MDLSRSVGKFATNSIYRWDFGASDWVDTGVKGSFLVYDRFISDRAFGQTKRLVMTPLDQAIDITVPKGIYKIEGNSARFMIESVNEDTGEEVSYANVYMFHDVAYPIVVKKDVGVLRASGIGKKDTPEVQDTLWADYSRYSAVNSREMGTVDYTVINLFLPRGTNIDTDCYVELDGMVFDVSEVATSLNILTCRAQRRGV